MTILWLLLAALAGWCIGLAVNYLADVLPQDNRSARPSCRACQAPLTARQYFPWPSPCPACAQAPKLRARLLPLGGAIAAVLAWFNPIEGLGPLWSWILLAYFGLVIVIDLEHRLILFPTTLFGALLSLAAGWLRNGLLSSLLGGLAGLALLLVMYLLGILFGRVLGLLRSQTINETVFGFGDVLLGGVLGLLVGWPAILSSLLYTILSAGLFSLLFLLVKLIQRRYQVATALPYGPFLILGATIVLLQI